MTTNEPIVTIEHCRALGYCARGMRTFFARYKLNWDAFRQRGTSASEIEATGDAMALAAANLAREDARRGGP